jgi:hypothetical protein
MEGRHSGGVGAATARRNTASSGDVASQERNTEGRHSNGGAQHVWMPPSVQGLFRRSQHVIGCGHV